MASAAKLCALPGIYAGGVRLDPLLIYESRDHLRFSRKQRHPESVDDISALKLDKDRLAYGNMQFICRGNGPIRIFMLILDSPPPIVSRYCHAECWSRRRFRY